MSFLKSLFKKDEPIKYYSDFWNWFKKHEKNFYNVVNKGKNIEAAFFDKLSPKLAELKDGYFFLAGMLDDHTAELVLTADGIIKNVVFVEELVNSAPTIPGWKFTALKPSSDIDHSCINMADYVFGTETLSFYSNDHADYPDEIDITIVHKDFNENDKSTIINGIYIFLDNYIGELNSVTTIDNVSVVGPHAAEKELVPIGKLKDFLNWRQKEFIEKYEGTLQDTENSEFSILEAELESGNALIATINTELLQWDKKASHPWIMTVEISYDGQENNGMPDNETFQRLGDIEDKILEQLKDHEGYLNIGRQTADSVREIYFACKDFRKPSKFMHQLVLDSPGDKITFDIYKDKYWRSFNRFKPGLD
jgi:hypothetical protein